jgi:hypothetical protein
MSHGEAAFRASKKWREKIGSDRAWTYTEWRDLTAEEKDTWENIAAAVIQNYVHEPWTTTHIR